MISSAGSTRRSSSSRRARSSRSPHMCSTRLGYVHPVRARPAAPDLPTTPRATDDVSMSTATVVRFFAVLSLIVWAATLIVIVRAVLPRKTPDSSAGYLFEDIRANSMWIAFVVALGTMLGSLYLSEVAHFQPCPLCWYQRICMYPLSVTLLVAGLRRDRLVWTYVLPPPVLGAGFAIAHTQLQPFPTQRGPFCKINAPCTVRYVWEFGFVSIPFMALAAFSFIIAMMFVLRSEPYEDDELEYESPDASDPEDAPAFSAQGAT